MIRIIFENGELIDLENVERLVLDKAEFVKEMQGNYDPKEDIFVIELKRRNSNERLSDMGC